MQSKGIRSLPSDRHLVTAPVACGLVTLVTGAVFCTGVNPILPVAFALAVAVGVSTLTSP